MIVVADTSPINYLVLIDEFDLLPRLFGKILIPKAVWAELSATVAPQPVREWVESSHDWVELASPKKLDASIKLGLGEVEAISLAREIAADLLLVDDRKARIAAMGHGLAVAGTINVLEAAAKRHLIDLAISFGKLRQTNFRIASTLLDEILKRNS